jgi:hypothetical protein
MITEHEKYDFMKDCPIEVEEIEELMHAGALAS